MVSTLFGIGVVKGWMESEAYLEPSGTFTMELFSKNSQRLAVNYFP